MYIYIYVYTSIVIYTFITAQDGLLVCWSDYQLLWSFLLSGYKIIIILITLFYAWHVRHVKLPSLQDSRYEKTTPNTRIAFCSIHSLHEPACVCKHCC